MRAGMRGKLEGYSAILKREAELKKQKGESEAVENLIQSELEQLSEELNKVIEERNQDTKVGAQEQVVVLQREKQQLMLDLKDGLYELDHSQQEWEPKNDERPVIYRDGQYFWIQQAKESREERAITLGEIVTDRVWGIHYSLDPSTVPRFAKKLQLIEMTKQKLWLLMDEQISALERNRRQSTGRQAGIFTLDVAESRERFFSSTRINKFESGYVAEQMVLNFFQKLIIDFDLPIQIVGGDLFQDFRQKTDIVVQKRGIREGSQQEGRCRLGIQLTLLDPSRPEYKKKKLQVSSARGQLTSDDEIDDVVLVSIPKSGIGEIWELWNQEGRPSGGPEKYWDEQIRETVFTRILEPLFGSAQTEQLWVRMREKSQASELSDREREND